MHEGSALCQSGLSLAYIPTGSVRVSLSFQREFLEMILPRRVQRSDVIAFGEPGAFQWSGRIEADYSDTLLRQRYAFKSAPHWPLPYSYLGKRSQRALLLYSLEQSVLLGYSVLIIKSQTRDPTDSSYIFIASAPRASNSRGEIRFFKKRFVSTNSFAYDTLQHIFHTTNNRSTPVILTGEQIGSYFGHSMAAGDLNGDGQTDLVISAPFYYSKKPSHGGAVYIYYGLNGTVSPVESDRHRSRVDVSSLVFQRST